MALMSNKKYSFSDLTSTYKDFSVPTVKVLIDGQNLLAKGDLIISGLKVELGCGMEASGCNFDIYNVFDEGARTFNKTLVSKNFQLGKKIEIELGYITTVKVFKGYISGLNFAVGEDMPKVTVEGTDVKGLMMNNQLNQQWANIKYNDVVSKILGSYGSFCTSNKVEDTGEVKKKIEMVNESDYDFIVRIAERLGFEFFVLEGIAYFRKPAPYKEPEITLEWGMNIHSLEKKTSLEGQVLEVEVRGYDENKGEVITGTAKSSTAMQTSAKTALKSLKKVITDSSIISADEAKKLAESILQRINRRYVDLRAECVGLPEVVPGRNIAISKLGEGIDGKYYVTKVTHQYNDSYFSTSIEARTGE